jgi:hypothetical protein
MIGPIASGTTTITSIDVHAEGKPGRILLGATCSCAEARPIR